MLIDTFPLLLFSLPLSSPLHMGCVDGRDPHGVRQRFAPGLLFTVSERSPPQLAAGQPPDWHMGCQELPGRVSCSFASDKRKLREIFFCIRQAAVEAGEQHHLNASLCFLQQKMKTGPFLSRVMKLFVYFHLVFTTGITFSYLVKVKSTTISCN